MHEIHTCTHLDFNKSYGCTCSTNKEDLNKTRYAEVYIVNGVENVDTNIPVASKMPVEEEK